MSISIEKIAKICHQANKAYCESIGDNSQLDWEQAPEWQRQSAINGVKFNLENRESPASASHDNWLKEKFNEGWIYGIKKDVDKKEHPCCVPYEELPEEQKTKDLLFKNIVLSM
jgi:RyR domain